MCGIGVEGNTTCQARTLSHPCVEDMLVNFSCPAGNNDSWREPTFEKSEGPDGIPPRIFCEVCGLDDSLNDTDPREGFIQLELYFGPNILAVGGGGGGIVYELGIIGYTVYMVDSCLRIRGAPVAEIDTIVGLDASCCTPKAYGVNVTAELPFNSSSMTLMIVPRTLGGNFSVGAVTRLYEDLVVFPRVGAIGAAPPMGVGGVLATLALVVLALPRAQ